LAITKEKKREIVADYTDKMSNSQAIILTEYRGLTVADMTELRRRMRELGCSFQVVKNTLFELALREAGLPTPADQLKGPVAVGYAGQEIPPAAKALLDFARETEILKIKGAIVGHRILDANGVQALATLPPREVLLAQLVGAVQGPMSNLIGTLNAPLRELVQVLKARAEQGQPAAA